MNSFRLTSLLILIPLCAVLIMTSGCTSRPAAAQKLFDQGEYQKVIDQYPELDVARRAHAKLGEKFLAEKQYDVVLREYSDTPAAYKARQAMVEKLFNEGRYMAILDSFPTFPQAQLAKERIADSLFAAGQFDQLLVRFGDTPKGLQVKQAKSTEALTQAKKLRGDAKRMALENITRTYNGTEAASEASSLLIKIREAEAKKKK
jgi:hypothetical protein